MFARRMLFSLVLLGLAVAPISAQEATLEWKLAKDKTFYQTMTTETKQTMKVMGTDVTQTQEQTFYFSWTPISDPKDDKITLTQKIIGVKMNIDIGGSKIAYDSTNKENPAASNPLNTFFSALTDAEFTITLDLKNQKVTDITGQDEFVKKLTNANPQMKPLLEKILSKQALMEMAEPLFAAVPGKKVKKGDTWERQSTLDMGPIGKYETKYTYTYDGPDANKLEKISVKSDLNYTPPDAGAAGGLPFKIKDAKLSSQDATGTVLFDPEAGRVQSIEMNLTLAGELTIEIGQQSTTVQLNQTQKTTITTSDMDPTKK